MPLIEIETVIQAPIERVFDLARSIDAHSTSTAGTGERAVAGRTTGLIEEGESVTWEARHFGIRQRLTSLISEMDRPNQFVDEMVEGAFRSIRHLHLFREDANATVMHDRFSFSAPLGLLGRVAEILFLERYMRRFLEDRNAVLKRIAESDEWKQYIF